MRRIGLIGVPSNSSGATDGVARGPEALREAGLIEALGSGADLRDYGDLSLPAPSRDRDPKTGLIDPQGFARLVPLVRDAVASVLDEGRFPLVIGGDCPLLIGCLLAVPDDRVGLLFVDGHEDAYLPAQSPTGEAADTELAFALGIADASWSPELSSMLPVADVADVHILGARDTATLGVEGVASLADRVPFVGADALAADPSGAARRACASLVRPWWFHVDLDVLSTDALPAVDYPQPGGLDWQALRLLSADALVVEPAGWDVTIYNPDLDPDRTHGRRIVRFLVDVLCADRRDGARHG